MSKARQRRPRPSPRRGAADAPTATHRGASNSALAEQVSAKGAAAGWAHGADPTWSDRAMIAPEAEAPGTASGLAPYWAQQQDDDFDNPVLWVPEAPATASGRQADYVQEEEPAAPRVLAEPESAWDEA